MAKNTKITTEQVIKIGDYLWENKEELSRYNRHEAFTRTVNATSITLSVTSFYKIVKELDLQFAQNRSTVASGIAVLKERYKIAELDTE